MKLVKGLIIGGAISVGIAMLYNERLNRKGRKVIRRGKKMAKKLGVI
ncbi:MAG: hypothetical protein Q4G05_01010 [Clostridia bacterium]|nr:hypothetical protein [Clostridia bacterium]